jgi:chromosome segregation ATPase
MEDSIEVEKMGTPDDSEETGEHRAWNVARESAASAILEDLENQYVSLKQDRDALKIQLDESEGKLRELNQMIAKQQNWELDAANYKHEVDLLNSKIVALQGDRKLMQELMDRQQAEADSLRENIR